MHATSTVQLNCMHVTFRTIALGKRRFGTLTYVILAASVSMCMLGHSNVPIRLCDSVNNKYLPNREDISRSQILLFYRNVSVKEKYIFDNEHH